MLGDSLSSLLPGRVQEIWDVVLPQVMRAYRSTPHTSTGETPTLLMLGRGTRVPDHLNYHIPEQDYSIYEYASEFGEKDAGRTRNTAGKAVAGATGRLQ